MTRVVRDRGAQQERTTLAWRRTGLSLVIGALTIGRLTLDSLGTLVVVPTVLAASLALWVVVVALRTRHSTTPAGDEPSFSILTDGRLPAVVAGVVGALAAGELLAAVVTLV